MIKSKLFHSDFFILKAGLITQGVVIVGSCVCVHITIIKINVIGGATPL
ncbi:MAG: hypothetical protein IJY58_03755 [Alphaproteobacteria bacterium]|nr:hypothetical protein [Alphaproteobacteria bacterium]